MTEQQRLAALEAFNNGFQTEQNGECFYTFPHDKTVLIREALQTPQPEVSEWQPIETAPRDGTQIVVLLNDCTATVTKRRFMVGGDEMWEGIYSARKPTHWMPLPKPPMGEDK